MTDTRTSLGSPSPVRLSAVRLTVYRGLLVPVRFFGLFPSTLCGVVLGGFGAWVWTFAMSGDRWMATLLGVVAVSVAGMVCHQWEAERPAPPWRRLRGWIRPGRYTAHEVIRR